MNKTATSAAQLAKRILLLAYIHVQLLVPAAREQTKTLRLKILKKLRTASLNSEFTGSLKKSVSDLYARHNKRFKNN